MSTATVDKVVSEVVQEALDNIRKSLDESEAEAYRIIERVEEELRRELAAIREAGKAEREAARQRILSTAEIQAKNMAIAAVEEEISKIFEAVERKLSQMASEDSFEMDLKRLLDEAVQLIGRDVVVESNEKGVQLLKRIVEKNSYSVRVSISEKPINTVGGLRAQSADGSVRFDNTFEARLERLKPMLRNEIAKMLLRKD
ncbi:MAG: V-type ATP synthase subunit E family protein [Candidatus Caldarchaeum sp.]